MPAPRKHKALTPVRVGNVSIPRYRLGDGRIQIIDRWPDGRRRPRNFTDARTAAAEAEKRARELHNGGAEAHAFSSSDRASFAQAARDVAPFGAPVHLATSEWAAARIRMGSHSFDQVIEAGLRALTRVPHPFPVIVAELLTSKSAKSLNGRYVRGIKNTGETFGEFFPGDIADVTAADIERFLAEKIKGGSRRRDNVLSEIRHIFQFARLRGYLPDTLTAARKVGTVGGRPTGIGIFTVPEIELFIRHTLREWQPFLLIGAFSGVRTEEISLAKDAARDKDPLRWEDFDWDDREIAIRPETAKTGFERRVPILDNLWAWLAPWRDERASGPVAPAGKRPDREFGNDGRLVRAINRILDGSPVTAGGQLLLGDDFEDGQSMSSITWKRNGLRHSYGTYRMAVLKNAHQVSEEMGNSPAVVKRNYHKPRPAREGRAWFSIMPETPANVLHLGSYDDATLSPRIAREG